MVGNSDCLQERDGIITENLINSVSVLSNHFFYLLHLATSNLSRLPRISS
jgi:hypothetical protein